MTMATNHGMKKREGQARRAEKLALKLALKAEKTSSRKAAASPISNKPPA